MKILPATAQRMRHDRSHRNHRNPRYAHRAIRCYGANQFRQVTRRKKGYMVMSPDTAIGVCFAIAFAIIIALNIVVKLEWKEWKGGGRD